jgi:hypothetical protein
MKKKFLLFALLFVSAHSLLAVPAVPFTVEKVQPDGTKITVYLKGDEKVNWMESEDGYTLMYDAQQYVVYAQQDAQGNLMPSTIKFGSATPSANIAKKLRYNQVQTNMLMQIAAMTSGAIQRVSTGNVNALCVLAGFADKPFSKTVAEFDNLMNQVGYTTGGAKGSVIDYYNENSYGRLQLHVTVVGPVKVSHNVSYYGTNSQYGDPLGIRYKTFASEVITLADPLVNYSQFATNGIVTNFHIIFAGYGDEDGLNQAFSYNWKDENVSLDYKTHVIWNNKQNSGEWYFDRIQNDSLFVYSYEINPCGFSNSYIFKKI